MKNLTQSIESLIESDECKFNIHGLSVVIQQDFSPESPRDECNLSTMWCWHKRYNLGDNDSNKPKSSDFNSWEEMEDHITSMFDVAVILPLFLYDHSGITISTTSFGCSWDSGQVGFIFITKEQAREMFRVKYITKQIRSKLLAEMVSEVKTYDSYITNCVYCFSLYSSDGNEISSCHGFFGSNHKESGLLDYLSNDVEYQLSLQRKHRVRTLKTWIRNKVPLNARQHTVYC